jgi:hypothetical protein
LHASFIPSSTVLIKRIVQYPRSLAVLSALALVACSSVEVSSSNLDEMHAAGGRYRYTARLNTPFRYLMQRLLDPIVMQEERWAFGNPIEVIEDPADVCLSNLLELARSSSRSPSVLANQVRTYAWLAVRDPFGLVRERAFLELAPHAKRLEIESIPLPPAAGSVVTPPEFLEAVRGLYEVAKPILVRGESASDTERADFMAAIELLGQFQYDIEGGRRLLKAIAILTEDVSSGSQSLLPLFGLSVHVQRQMAAEALRVGLQDTDARARSAAYQASYQVFGNAFLMEAVETMTATIKAPSGASALFRLEPLAKADVEVYVGICELLRQDGLPVDDGASEEAIVKASMKATSILLSIGVNHTLFEERAQIAALLALEAIHPTGPASLRSEEWWTWWTGWTDEQESRLQTLSPADRGEEGASAAETAPSEPTIPTGSKGFAPDAPSAGSPAAATNS